MLKPKLVRRLLPDRKLNPIQRRKRLVRKNADSSSTPPLSTTDGSQPMLRAAYFWCWLGVPLTDRSLLASTGRGALHILKQAKVFRDSGNSAQVSNLAQTQKPTTVILYPAECIERVTTATSQLSFLGRRG
jgi:hypothetical protein